MDCPECNIEMMICGCDYTAEGDNDPTTPTKMYHTAVCACRNPQCKLHGMKFNAGAVELPKAQVDRRFCRKCGALLAEVESGKIIFQPTVTEMPLVSGEYHIRCPACETEEVLPAGETDITKEPPKETKEPEKPAEKPPEETTRKLPEEYAPGA